MTSTNIWLYDRSRSNVLWLTFSRTRQCPPGQAVDFSAQWVAVTRARARRTGSGCGGGAWRQLGRTFDVRPWASRSRSSSRSLCPSRARTLPRRRRTNPASEANLEPRTRQLGVARALLRRVPASLGVSNPAPTHSGESARAFLADPVLGWRLLSGRPCVASPRPRGSRLAALARRARRAWSLVVLAATAELGRRANCGVERACARSASRLTRRLSSAPPPPRCPPSRRRLF